MKNKAIITSLVVTPLAIMVLMASTSFAATPTPTTSDPSTQGVIGGPLELIAPPSYLNLSSAFSSIQFSPITLNGDQQTATANLGSLVAVDATGTGQGWNITVSASQFTEQLSSGASGTPLTLPTGSLKLTPPSSITGVAIIQSDQPTISTPPNNVSTSPVTIDNGNASGVKVVSATTKNGMGAYLIRFPANALTLTLNPATTYVDSTHYPGSATPYSTTLSWQINVGP